jgi:hypothetical protein
LIGLGVIFAVNLGKAFLVGFSSTFAPGEMVNKAKQIAQQEKSGYAVSTFEAVNQERKKIGISELVIDENLCAYARKKSTELAISLEESPQLDLAIEIKDASNQVYFKEFKTLGINYQGGGVLKRPDSNLAQMFVYQGSKAASNLDLTHGCVADSQEANGGRVYTVFVGGQKP